jgi:predicted secreted protein
VTAVHRLAAFALALLPAAASAGDYAERTVIGFSPDGGYFAFIEYGVQDGSGFPYANAFVIDTARDAWVQGTPARVLIEDEGSSASAAYNQALVAVRPLIERHGISASPVVVAYNPMTEVSADPHNVSFLRRMPVPPNTSETYRLTLEEAERPAPGCPEMVDPFVGMHLVLTDPTGNQGVLADDKQIPASRRCPIGYRISEVMFDPTLTVVAVLVDVMSVGFEGADRRFLAVTARLPE